MFQNMWLHSILLVTTLSLVHKTTSTATYSQIYHYCYSNTTVFTNGSTYQANLKTLLHSLSSNATNNPSGFYRTTVGNPAVEAVYGHFLCRGDLNSSSCHDCVTTATTTDLPITYCPNRKNAIIWYDECMVRYSNDSFFNKMDQFPQLTMWNTNDIARNATGFIETVDDLMYNVIATKAAEGGPFKKFATDDANFTNFKTIYGLGQCTPDLTPSDCNLCLSSSIQRLRNTSLGGRLLAPSCVVRYELYSFFNLSYLPSPSPSPQPSPQPSPANDSNPIITPNGSTGKKKVSTKLLVSIIAALLVFSFALFPICICLLKKKARKTTDVVTDFRISNEEFTAESLQYDLETLLRATNNFSAENKLGEGGFGGVYKGVLSDGQLIAVKRLSGSSSQGIQEFKTEVLLVAKLQHRNLVRLFGFCYTGQEKLLVYEHVANKSLDNFLFDDENRRQLDWQRRYNIIRGIARGLLYLHHDSQLRIIHRDLKASNILLDEDMNPKISDFGTSRILGVDQSRSNYTSRVVGTYGYMAPEYALHGQFSIKSDAYSFGVLVLEIICGRKCTTFDLLGNDDDLLSYVWKHWEAGTPLECVDPSIRDSCSNNSEVMRCLHIGLLCVQESVEDRLTLVDVVLTIDSHTVSLPVPAPSGFGAMTRIKPPSYLKVGSDDNSSRSGEVGLLSVNDVSITEPGPR